MDGMKGEIAAVMMDVLSVDCSVVEKAVTKAGEKDDQ